METLTTLGGGNHGLLGITMEPGEYEAKTRITFLCTTVKPPPYNTTTPNAASIQVLTKYKAKHKDNI